MAPKQRRPPAKISRTARKPASKRRPINPPQNNTAGDKVQPLPRSKTATARYALRDPKFRQDATPRHRAVEPAKPRSRKASTRLPKESSRTSKKKHQQYSAKQGSLRKGEGQTRPTVGKTNTKRIHSSSIHSNQSFSNFVNQALQQEFQGFKLEFVRDIEDLRRIAQDLSVISPDLRLIGKSVEKLLFKIVDIGYVPSIEVARPQAENLSNISGSGLQPMAPRGNALTTPSISLPGTTPSNDGSKENKVKKFYDLGLNDKQQVLESHRIDIDEELAINENEALGDERVEADIANDNEQHWQQDLRKCRGNGKEQHLQCTIMQKTINRHNFSGFNDVLDYSIGMDWSEAPPPNTNDTRSYRLRNINVSAPKPDLCVGFQPRHLFSARHSKYDLTSSQRTHMVPEKKSGATDPGRAFIFLMMEFKGSDSPDMKKVNYQAVNDAAHALNNIWQFMKVNEELEERFFSSVKVFTASGHGDRFWVRVHKAMRLDVQECPMSFRYRTIFDTRDNLQYSQEQVQALIKRIMHWGIRELEPLVKEALEVVCDNAIEQRAAKRGRTREDDGSPSKRHRSAAEADAPFGSHTQATQNLENFSLSPG